jgi:hypothetical protein
VVHAATIMATVVLVIQVAIAILVLARPRTFTIHSVLMSHILFWSMVALIALTNSQDIMLIVCTVPCVLLIITILWRVPWMLHVAFARYNVTMTQREGRVRALRLGDVGVSDLFLKYMV